MCAGPLGVPGVRPTGTGTTPMSPHAPAISVIIPTHNRRDSVCRTLAALSRQTIDPAEFEVIVIADGCVDDTATVLRSRHYPFQFQLIEQPGQGQGKARNTGAEAARGELLVFLDDDIEPFPVMLAAYREYHHAWPGRLVLGLAYPVLREEDSLFSHGLRNWWNDHIRSEHEQHQCYLASQWNRKCISERRQQFWLRYDSNSKQY